LKNCKKGKNIKRDKIKKIKKNDRQSQTGDLFGHVPPLHGGDVKTNLKLTWNDNFGYRN
jgi:hypothetical protein